MTALSLEARAADQASVDDFEVVYVTEGGAERTLPLTAGWAVAFECGCPVRRLRSRKGQRHLSGLWWSATTGGHVDFESWLERDHVMALDFDAAMVGIASAVGQSVVADGVDLPVIGRLAELIDGSDAQRPAMSPLADARVGERPAGPVYFETTFEESDVNCSGD